MTDGELKSVKASSLVPGDVVRLNVGDMIPADIRLIESHEFRVNEMILTGETEEVNKTVNPTPAFVKKSLNPPNMVYSSTSVGAGSALGVVVEIGMCTRVGQIALLIQDGGESEKTAKSPAAKTAAPAAPVVLPLKAPTPANRGLLLQSTASAVPTAPQQPAPLPPSSSAETATTTDRRTRNTATPMQRAVHRLSVVMSTLGFSICIVVFFVGLARGVSDPAHGNSGQPLELQMLIIAVSLAISAVPEGLPLVVTICLALV